MNINEILSKKRSIFGMIELDWNRVRKFFSGDYKNFNNEETRDILAPIAWFMWEYFSYDEGKSHKYIFYNDRKWLWSDVAGISYCLHDATGLNIETVELDEVIEKYRQVMNDLFDKYNKQIF